ncbi:YebC/PmpR family DNA-binding transcriptional regulator [Nitrosophilus labii]|uniref:YebC/PmpR family DNA-binding transcriptional regulator n=1 Tax=Nitrosophilus labii TaxID=2706014 RepID=UPI00165756D3|nr:YebC/PmpR family DNA-binding transcriptional regulator [Nitrosophilus labii]
MAGHNKWSKVKHIKAKEDAKKGKLFTKAVRDIMTAVRDGGPNPDTNAALRLAIERAKAVSMPSDNIKRAIDKASGNLPGVKYEEITYEGYGPGGVALIVETLTDNKNRTVAAVRHAFNKMGGSLGTSGSVSWMFDKKGVITVERSDKDDEVMEAALENGANDILEFEEVLVIESDPADFNTLLQAVESTGTNILESNVGLVANNEIEVDDATAEKVEKLIEILEENDDVQNVYYNMK